MCHLKEVLCQQHELILHLGHYQIELLNRLQEINLTILMKQNLMPVHQHLKVCLHLQLSMIMFLIHLLIILDLLNHQQLVKHMQLIQYYYLL